jgi:hypothetical protein
MLENVQTHMLTAIHVHATFQCLMSAFIQLQDETP